MSSALKNNEILSSQYFLTSTGVLGTLINDYDWSVTPLGPIAHWPQILKTTISIILNSPHPMCITWGAAQTIIYNDAYINVLGLSKHPWALGRSFVEVWAELWGSHGLLIEKALQERQAICLDNVQLFIRRQSYVEEMYVSFTYSPIIDELGLANGLFCTCTEITAKVLNEKRLKTLSELSKGSCITAIDMLVKNYADVLFALLYVVDEKRKTAQCVKAADVLKEMSVKYPPTVNLINNIAQQEIWPIAEVIKTGTAKTILAGQPVTQMLLLPIISPNQGVAIGVLIVGINPEQRLDDEYVTFFNLVAERMATAVERTKYLAEENQKIPSEVLEHKQLHLKNSHILLATNDIDMSGYFKDLLNPYYSVTLVADGRETYEVVIKSEPDLILLDARLPSLAEISLAQKLRANAKIKHIPIILLSAEAHEVPYAEVLQIEADDYLAKPFSDKKLLARIRTHLELSHLRAKANLEREKVLAVFMQAPVAICVLEGPEHIFIMANPKYMEFFEGERILIGKPVREALSELEPQGIIELLDNTYKTGIPCMASEKEVYLLNSNGERKQVYVDFIYEPIRDLNGEINGIVVVCTDVTTKVLTHKKIEEAERRLKIALTSVQMGAWDYDFATRKIYCDEVACKLMSLQGKDLLQMPRTILGRIVHPADLAHTLHIFTEAIRQREDIKFECRVIWSDNSTHWIQIAAKIIKDNEGLLQRIVGTVVETTAKKHGEQVLKNAISVRDEFLSVASHELKTPITSLKLQIQLAQRRIEPLNDVIIKEQLASSFAVILRQADRLTNLINDLLDVSRIQAGKMVFHFEPTALYELTNDIIERYSNEFKLNNITVHTEFQKEIIGIWDKSRIDQVIVNLLNNTIKYASGKPVYISAKQEDKWVVYTVKDFGVGIPKNKQNLIFQRFERASNENSGSLGLGLFIVKRIIENHYGTISVESEEGQGAIFIIRLPIDASIK